MYNSIKLPIVLLFSYIFVADQGSKEIIRIESATRVVQKIVTTLLVSPNGLTIDSANQKLFWNDIQKYYLFIIDTQIHILPNIGIVVKLIYFQQNLCF